MNATTITNNKPQRKQLSDQLDRLDDILDALSEGLNGAVADAAREGTRLAIKDAIIEIMTDPTLRARLHETTALEPAPEPARKPGWWARLKAQAGRVLAAVGHTASQLAQGTVRKGREVADAAVMGAHIVKGLAHWKNLALLGVGVGVGVAVGGASFLAPHAVAATVSGITGAVAATAIQLGGWTRRAVRAMSLE